MYNIAVTVATTYSSLVYASRDIIILFGWEYFAIRYTYLFIKMTIFCRSKKSTVPVSQPLVLLAPEMVDIRKTFLVLSYFPLTPLSSHSRFYSEYIEYFRYPKEITPVYRHSLRDENLHHFLKMKYIDDTGRFSKEKEYDIFNEHNYWYPFSSNIDFFQIPMDDEKKLEGIHIEQGMGNYAFSFLGYLIIVILFRRHPSCPVTKLFIEQHLPSLLPLLSEGKTKQWFGIREEIFFKEFLISYFSFINSKLTDKEQFYIWPNKEGYNSVVKNFFNVFLQPNIAKESLSPDTVFYGGDDIEKAKEEGAYLDEFFTYQHLKFCFPSNQGKLAFFPQAYLSSLHGKLFEGVDSLCYPFICDDLLSWKESYTFEIDASLNFVCVKGDVPFGMQKFDSTLLDGECLFVPADHENRLSILFSKVGISDFKIPRIYDYTSYDTAIRLHLEKPNSSKEDFVVPCLSKNLNYLLTNYFSHVVTLLEHPVQSKELLQAILAERERICEIIPEVLDNYFANIEHRLNNWPMSFVPLQQRALRSCFVNTIVGFSGKGNNSFGCYLTESEREGILKSSKTSIPAEMSILAFPQDSFISSP